MSVSLPALAQTTAKGIILESVDNYSACNGPSLANPIADVTGFITTVLGSANPAGFFKDGTGWTNGQVYPTDFYDPEVSGNASDDDTRNFDNSIDAISYFDGHGYCNGPGLTNNQACLGVGDCQTPPANASMPGACLVYPGDNQGQCIYLDNTRAIVTAVCTSPHSDGAARYGSGQLAFGESAYSGSWRGAGTNGGTNMAIISSSCAEYGGMPNAIFPLFAGVHVINTTMVVSGDYASTTDRGTAFANRYAMNPAGSAADAWGDAINSIGNRNSWCKNRSGSVSYGGGYGFNGCGVQMSSAMDAYASNAISHLSESWTSITSNLLDAYGTSYYYYTAQCNYDCGRYPWILP
jgi:hypothetical protein